MEFSDKLKSLLKSSKNVVAICGAGISQESGVPTFRGKGGLWEKYRPEELANFDAFIKNPVLVWEWYNYRKKLISEVNPNPGHYALYEMENLFEKFFIITQNVDGLHHKAGNKNVIEIHGNIMHSKCIECDKIHYDVPIQEKVVSIPKCECGGMIRPNVVWFGELISENLLMDSYKLLKDCQLLFVIGTSGNVYPVASFPIIAKENDAYLVEINKEKTTISYMMDEILEGQAGVFLPKIVEIIKN
jgi:NAD-dependent deacetylase